MKILPRPRTALKRTVASYKSFFVLMIVQRDLLINRILDWEFFGNTHNFLSYSYFLAVTAVIATNSRSAAGYIVTIAVGPLLIFELIRLRRKIPILSLFSSSIIFWSAMVYLASLLTSTYLSTGIQPADPRPYSLWAIWSAQLIIFLMATAVLTAFSIGFFQRLLLAMCSLLALNALVNMWFFFRVSDLTIYSRLSARFGTRDYQNATHIGPLFALYFVPSANGLRTWKLKKFDKTRLAFCLLALMSAILLSQARSAYLLLSLGVIAIAMTLSITGRVVIGVLLLAVCAILFSNESTHALLLSRGASYRIDLWRSYLQIAQNGPFNGFGLDRYLEVKIDHYTFEQPHNAFIWSLIRGGPIAFISVLSMTGVSVLTTCRYWIREKDAGPLLLVLGMIMISITEIGYLVFPFNWLWIVFWLPIGVALGTEIFLRHNTLKK